MTASSASIRPNPMRIGLIHLTLCLCPIFTGCYNGVGAQGGLRVTSNGDVSLTFAGSLEAGPGGSRHQNVRVSSKFPEGRQPAPFVGFFGAPRLQLGGGINVTTLRPEASLLLGLGFDFADTAEAGERTIGAGLGLKTVVKWDEEWTAKPWFGPSGSLSVGEIVSVEQVGSGRYDLVRRSLEFSTAILFGRREDKEDWMLVFGLQGSLYKLFVGEASNCPTCSS